MATRAKKAPAPLEVVLAHGIGVIWLRGATLDAPTIAQLGGALEPLAGESKVRAIVLASRGEAFCAGADASGEPLAALLDLLDTFPKPTVARIHGAAAGAGVGLASVCDIAVAATGVSLCLADARGAVPPAIVPHVVAAIGRHAAQRYLLTGESFDSSEAYRLGLVHELAPAAELDATVNGLLGHLVQRDARSAKRLLQRNAKCSTRS